MPEPSEINGERVISVGPDRVTVNDHQVVIEAKWPMPEWEVRSSRPPAVYFEDKKFLLVEKAKAPAPYSVRYVLQPWPDGKIANDRLFHTYDTASVAERDSSRRGDFFDTVARAFLLPLYPVLGFLWSGMQERLVRFGFIPRTITGISIFVSFALVLVQGVLASIMINASARSGQMMIGGLIRSMVDSNYLHLGPVAFPVAVIDVFLFVSLASDLAMRYTHYLREDQWTGGFLEWLLPKSWRGK